MIHHPKLGKAIQHLVDRFGPIEGRTRLLKLVYLADLEWSRRHGGEPYTEAEYYRWNHGPYAREFPATLEAMDGLEIVELTSVGYGGPQYSYEPGSPLRLKNTKLDPDFREILDGVGRRWVREPLRSLLDYVYSDEAMANKHLGDSILARAPETALAS